MNTFVDDWKSLAEEEGTFGDKTDTHLKEYQSFTDLHNLAEKMITCICWHPVVCGERDPAGRPLWADADRVKPQTGSLPMRHRPFPSAGTCLPSTFCAFSHHVSSQLPHGTALGSLQAGDQSSTRGNDWLRSPSCCNAESGFAWGLTTTKANFLPLMPCGPDYWAR